MAAFDKEEESGPMKIGDLNQYSRQINVVVKVISKTDVREVVTRNDETQHKVCEALVADDTGAIYLTLWDEAVEKVQEDQILAVNNAYMNTFKGSMRMNIGRYGSYEVREEAPFTDVNLENNLSAKQVEYDGGSRGGGGFSGRGDQSYGRGRRY
jgi:ssDNA-binding replication factor A large subunit